MIDNTSRPFVIFHKDHKLDPVGVNAGAETAVLQLARALCKLGRRVYLAAQLPVGFTDALEPKTRTFTDGVSYLDFGSSFDTASVFRQLEEDFHLDSYHLIAACHAKALLESKSDTRVCSRMFITHEPSTEAFGVEPRVLGTEADIVICVSDVQKQAVLSAGCAPENVVVVHNGADLALFQPGDLEKRDFHKLGFVGALVIDKGVHVLLDAFARLKSTERFSSLTLDLYGSAELWGRENYFDIEAAAKIAPDIVFHGAVSQQTLAQVYQSIGLLVQPSIMFESFGLSVVEAQVSGLPAIGSADGGMREIIYDGETGRLLSGITAEMLASEIASLVGAPEKLKEMSRLCLQRKRKQFSWETTASRVIELAESCGESSVAESVNVASKALDDRSLVLQEMLAQVPIEDLLPKLDWEGQPRRSAAQALCLMAGAFIEVSDLECALECLDTSLELEETKEALLRKAFLLQKAGDRLQSEELFLKAESLDELPSLSGMQIPAAFLEKLGKK